MLTNLFIKFKFVEMVNIKRDIDINNNVLIKVVNNVNVNNNVNISKNVSNINELVMMVIDVKLLVNEIWMQLSLFFLILVSLLL